jgi:hypothetical protein
LRNPREERDARENVVMQQMEHDDMASEQHRDESAIAGRKPPGDRQPPSPQQPQIPSPLSSDGPELLRDSHC